MVIYPSFTQGKVTPLIIDFRNKYKHLCSPVEKIRQLELQIDYSRLYIHPLIIPPKGKRKKTIVIRPVFLEHETEQQVQERDEAVARYLLQFKMARG